MKNLIVLFFAAFILSCSSDSSEVVTEPVGFWRLEKIIVNSKEYLADDCMSQMTYSLNEDQSVDHNKILFLAPVDPNAECTPAEEEYQYYTWNKITDASFQFEYQIQGEDPSERTFTIENKRLKVQVSEDVTEFYIKE